MHEITVPKVNSNDEFYILVEWLAADGDELAPDSPVAVLETSKAAEELVAEAGGFLHQEVAANAECAVGTVIGRLFPTEQARADYLAATPPDWPGPPATPPDWPGPPATPPDWPGPPATARAGSAPALPARDLVITRSARDAAAELGVDLSELPALGKKVIKRQDIEALAARAREPVTDGASEIRLSAAQRAVGQVVTRSHRSIPSAFLAVKVPADPALRLRADLAARSQADVGLPELLVKAVGGLRERFPPCFGGYQEGGTVSVAPGAHTGITLDLGQGLYVPVIKHADTRSLAGIADTLAGFRISALRGSFREADLAGGNITISLSNDADTVLARPIIFPGQTCMLCLCGTQEELYRTSAGDIAVRHFFNLGLTYDHRVINGREASEFLHELKSALSEPDCLSRITTAVHSNERF
jgi:2-oxoglutarate dehydrogenase E2 component (dihydrolipoamide succinyltransferase)